MPPMRLRPPRHAGAVPGVRGGDLGNDRVADRLFARRAFDRRGAGDLPSRPSPPPAMRNPLLRTTAALLICCSCALSTFARPEGAAGMKGGLFARENLVAWCIVPFDAKQRGPAERAEMLARIGVTRVAYDWRDH